MFIILDIALSLILALLFIATYIFAEKIRISKFFFRWNIYDYVKNAIEGLTYGMLIVFFNFILKAIEPNFIVPIFVVGVLVLSLIRNVIVGMFSIFAPIIYYLIVEQTDNSFYVILGLMCIMLLVIQIVHFFNDNFIVNLILNSIWILLALCIVLGYDFIVNNQINQFTVEVIFMPYISLMIVYIGLEIAIKFLISANILYKSVSFNFSRYYRQALREVVIGEFIDELKLGRGIYGILDFNYAPQSTIEKDLEMKESILLDLEKRFPHQTVLFRADESRYGFFLPVNQKFNLIKMLAGNDKFVREPKDLLKNLETMLYSCPNVYLTSWKEKITLKIRSGVAIYGLHDYSITNLHNLADFALKNEQSSQKNIVQLFNPRDYFKNLHEQKAINEMDASIKLDNFINYFTPIFDLKINKTVFNIVTPEKVEYSEIKESVRDYINFLGWTSTFDRYMAFWALSTTLSLKNSVHNQLAFFYSPQIFEHNFDIGNFQQRFLKFNQPLNKTLLILDPYIFAQIKNIDVVFKNIDWLKKIGIKFAIINGHELSHEYFMKLDFDYVLMDGVKSFEKFIQKHQVWNKQKMIWFNINQQEDFNFAIKQKARFIGGSLFQKSQFVGKLDKKSKIYIDELLKNRSN